MNVFIALLEVVPLDDEVFGSSVTGAFVRGYVLAKDDADALTKFRSALSEMDITVVEVEWCHQEDAVDWEDPDNHEARRLVAEAQSTGNVVFDQFNTWFEDPGDPDPDPDPERQIH